MDDLNSKMVDELVHSGWITTARVEAAFRSTPRHLFLPDVDHETVYSGHAIPIKHDMGGLPISSSSEPAIMAMMLEQLALTTGQSVLEVGTGSGYNAALLGSLVGDSGRVRTIDIDDDLVARAEQHLRLAGAANVEPVAGDGWGGYEADAPYDRIEVTVGVSDLSPAWEDQLVDDGIIVAPLWLRAGVQASVAFRREGSGLVSAGIAPCGFMRLRGPHAGPESFVHLDEWVLCDDTGDPDQLDAALRLLSSTPSISPAPDLPGDWFTQVALSHPSPIRMWTREEPWLDRQGIMLPGQTGIAVVEGDRIYTFGDGRPKDELFRAASVPARRLEDVVVQARRTRTAEQAPGATFVRPGFSYSLAWPS